MLLQHRREQLSTGLLHVCLLCQLTLGIALEVRGFRDTLVTGLNDASGVSHRRILPEHVLVAVAGAIIPENITAESREICVPREMKLELRSWVFSILMMRVTATKGNLDSIRLSLA